MIYTWKKINENIYILQYPKYQFNTQKAAVSYGIINSNDEPSVYYNISSPGNDCTITHEVTTNDSYYVWVVDEYGNKERCSVDVTYIDVEDPIIEGFSIENKKFKRRCW